MRLSNKASIELSMNFLVTIIISILLLGLGILLLRQFVTATQQSQDVLDAKTEQQIAALLDQGQQIAIPFSNKELKRGEEHLFGIGILNILNENNFQIIITKSTAVDKNNNDLEINEAGWLTYNPNPFTISKNGKRTANVLVSVPKNATSGTYIFSVRVMNGQDIYDNIKKITITVS